MWLLCCCALSLSSLLSLLPSPPLHPVCPLFHPNCPCPRCLAVLGIDGSKDNLVPSLIIFLMKLLAHLKNSGPYPSADAKGDTHCNRLDSMLAAAMTRTTTTMTTIVEDREMTLVHASGGMIHWVHSPSFPGYCHRRLPAPPSQRQGQGGKRSNNNLLGHWHLAANHR